MQKLLALWNGFFPDGLFYLLTLVVFIIGCLKCIRPISRNVSALERAADMLKEGASAKLARPVWQDVKFLGKGAQPVWHSFLNSMSAVGENAQACDVADYVNEETIIDGPGRASLADLIPGFCTSLGILGTFVGLSLGLSGVDLMDTATYADLTNGISLAFYTSIVGVIASLTFNFMHRFAIGRARRAIDRFVDAFYACGVPQPAEPGAQLLAYQREQADAITGFTRALGERVADQIYQAVSAAMAPMQQSMDRFMNAATRAQVEGMDYIVNRFVERMDATLSGQLKGLAGMLDEMNAAQRRSGEETIKTAEAVSGLAEQMKQLQKETSDTLGRFTSFVDAVDKAYHQIDRTQTDTVELLDEIADAQSKQARYLSALQEYQTKLQASFQDYTVWTDKFVSSMEDKTKAQNEALEQVAGDMRQSADMLGSAYKTFVESIEVGLANALGLFDENMQNLVRQITGALGQIDRTMRDVEASMRRVSGKAPAAKPAGGEREVS